MSTKELNIVAGPNGAGKSTFVAEFLSERPMPLVCADVIATELQHLDPISRQIAAGRMFLRRFDEQLAKDEDFIIETTLSGRTTRTLLAEVQAAKFVITIAFICVDSPDICVARVDERVRRGGHNIPENDIRRRFPRSCANFWHVYRKIADQWVVYYNAGTVFVEVAFGDRDDFAVSDDGLFGRFLALTEVIGNG